MLKAEQFLSCATASNSSPWIDLRLAARATVGGTESRAAISFTLDRLATDFSTETVPPAGDVSPYGVGTSCSIPN